MASTESWQDRVVVFFLFFLQGGGPLVFFLPYLVLDAVALFQTDLVCNLGVLLDSGLLLE